MNPASIYLLNLEEIKGHASTMKENSQFRALNYAWRYIRRSSHDFG